MTVNLYTILVRYLVPVLFLFTIFSNAQQYDFGYNDINYNINNGFPSSELHFSIRDSENFLWFATDKGLARYNGINFEPYNISSKLSDSNVNHIYEDDDKKVWFLGDYSASYYDLVNNVIVPYEFNEILIKNSVSSSFKAIFVKEKIVYIILEDRGYLKISEKGKLSKHPEKVMYDLANGFFTWENNNYRPIIFNDNKIKSNLLQKINSGENNQEIFCRANKLVTINKDALSIDIRDSNKEEVITRTFANKINSISFSQHARTILICTQKGIIKYITDYDQQLEFLQNENINYALDGSKIGLFVLSENNGLFKIPNNGTLSLYKEGRIYKQPIENLVALDGYLNIYFRGSGNISYSDYSFKPVGSMLNLKDLKDMQANTYNEPINVQLPQNITFINTPKVSSIKCKSFDYKNNSLFILTENNGILEVFENKITRLKNLDYLISKLNTISNFNNKLWLGTSTGWYFYYLSSKSLFQAKSSSVFNITKILNFKDEKLIFGTKNNGFIIFHKKYYSQIEENDGLISNLIHDFIIQDNNIWAATSKGAMKLSYINNNFVTTDAYTFSDGLNSPDLNSIAYYNQEIFVSSKKGLNKIKPILKSKNNLKVYLKSFYIDNDLVPNNTKFTIPHKKSVKIDFLISSFNSQSPRVYYRLKGLNDEFKITNNLEVTYESLRAGNYVLEYYAQDFIETTPIKTISIKVSTPWYTKWYVLLLALLFIAYISYYLINRNSTKIKEKYRKEQENNRYKLLAFNKQMSSHFISNSFNAINNFILRNDNVGGSRYLSKMSRLFRHSLLATEKNYIPFNQEIEAITSYIELEKLRYNDSFKYDIILDDEISSQKIEIMPLILQTLTENAIWHGLLPSTQQNKMLEIKISKSEYPNLLKVEIIDNGSGINLEDYQKEDSKGISLVKAILQTNPYTKTIESEKIITFVNREKEGLNKGTICTVYIPVIYAV